MELTDAYSYIYKLRGTLNIEERVEEVTEEFISIKDNAGKIKFLEFLLTQRKLMPNSGFKSDKNEELAKSYRLQGNEEFVKKNYLESLEFYNKSLCFTPYETTSENMALVYANRSAVYFELKLYTKSYENAEDALSFGYSNVDTLKERMEKCEEEGMDDFYIQFISKPIASEFFELSRNPNPKIPFIADCLELKTSDTFGRHVITKKKLEVGEIIAVEEPFSKCLTKDHNYKYCCNCLEDNCLSLFPCPNCTQAMFCSTECQNQAMYKFHAFECCIIDVLNKVCTKSMRIAVHTLFESLAIFKFDVLDLRNALFEINDMPSTVFEHNLNNPRDPKITKARLLSSIDSLMTNEKSSNTADMFLRSGIVAIMTHLYLQHTSLKEIFNTSETQDFFRSFVFKQNQIATINYQGIFDGINSQYATGSFPFCSLVNHSCAPNIVRVSFNTKNILIVNRPIEAGGQLFDNYGYHHCLEDLAKRQSSLQKHYKFKCECAACVNNYPLFSDLPRVDEKFNNFIGNDLTALSYMNLKTAEDRFKVYCSYLSKMNSKYPCYEISCLQECKLLCAIIFKTPYYKLESCNKLD